MQENIVFHKLTRCDFKILVYTFADLNNITHPDYWNDKKAARND